MQSGPTLNLKSQGLTTRWVIGHYLSRHGFPPRLGASRIPITVTESNSIFCYIIVKVFRLSVISMIFQDTYPWKGRF